MFETIYGLHKETYELIIQLDNQREERQPLIHPKNTMLGYTVHKCELIELDKQLAEEEKAIIELLNQYRRHITDFNEKKILCNLQEEKVRLNYERMALTEELKDNTLQRLSVINSLKKYNVA